MTKDFDYHQHNKSFQVYKDWDIYLEDLENEEIGELFKALFAFAKNGKQAEFMGALKMVFLMMAQSIERDGKKWEQTAQRRKDGGKKGGRPPTGENQ
jgi:hypothetical protein